MHKARENVNGTFSIGKTWMLDDLSAVRSYNGSKPETLEEEQWKQWAGGIGFIVTIGKPYYWQANTQKEKQFFIASLVKIYTKYTGGRTPQLNGFDLREMDQLLGVSGRSLPPSANQSPSGPAPSHPQPQIRPPRRDPSREPALRTEPSRDAMQRPSAQSSPVVTQSYNSPSSRPPIRSRRDESPSGSMDSSGTGTQQNQPSLRRLAGTNQSQESFARSEDAASLPPRSRGGLNGIPNAPGRFQDRSATPNSQRAATPDSTFASSRDVEDDIPPVPAPLEIPPERRRPPMPIIGDSRQPGQALNEDIVPAPLASPAMRREDMRLPVRSIERNQPRDMESPVSAVSLNGQKRTDSPRSATEDMKRAESAQSPLSAQSIKPPQSAISAISSPLAQTPVEPEPEEETRPGLGPMIKKIKSPIESVKSPTESPLSPATGTDDEERPGLGPMIKRKMSRPEIANTFLRAAKSANAFSTFKPRAGGAAEKLRAAAAKSQEEEKGPDGITGVVPAPSLVRANGSISNVTTPTGNTNETASPRKVKDNLPEVKITVPQSDRPNSVGGPAKTQDNDTVDKSKTQGKRPKPASETMQKELASLGIDPGILDGRGLGLVSAWDEFGWVGDGVHTKNVDQMKEEIERELNKVQAGGWLSRMEEEDERVELIKAGLDKCIDECDELDGLLTLYLVELSVSHVFQTAKFKLNF
jgi:hypothetical protein